MKRNAISVLAVDSREKDRQALVRFLMEWDFQPAPASTPAEASAQLRDRAPAIAVIADRDGAGAELARALRRERAELEVILASPSAESAEYQTAAFLAGAYICLALPLNFHELARDLISLRQSVHARSDRRAWESAAGDPAGLPAGLDEMAGRSAPMQAVFASMRRCAPEDSPVLISGLTGTGKEMAAITLHRLGRRAQVPLLIYRCCGLSATQAERELFGDSGPRAPRMADRESQLLPVAAGVLECARGGTLLLDEIAELPEAVQARLAKELRAYLATGAGRRKTSDDDLRLLATTRLNLAEEVGCGRFNAALYRLLSANVIHLPSLSERQADIPLLSLHFQTRFCREHGKPAGGFSPEAQQALQTYPWPGNVRELENVIDGACLLAERGRVELVDLSIIQAGAQEIIQAKLRANAQADGAFPSAFGERYPAGRTDDMRDAQRRPPRPRSSLPPSPRSTRSAES